MNGTCATALNVGGRAEFSSVYVINGMILTILNFVYSEYSMSASVSDGGPGGVSSVIIARCGAVVAVAFGSARAGAAGVASLGGVGCERGDRPGRSGDKVCCWGVFVACAFDFSFLESRRSSRCS